MEWHTYQLKRLAPRGIRVQVPSCPPNKSHNAQNLCQCILMDRMRFYESCDRGSIPLTGTSFMGM